MRSSLRQSDAKVAVLLCTTAVALMFLPSAIADSVRTVALDVSRPGQSVAHWTSERCLTAWRSLLSTSAHEARIDDLRDELEVWKARCRALEIESAVARRDKEHAEQTRSSSLIGEAGRPLVVPQLLEAKVLGQEFVSMWSAGLFLDRGQTRGIAETSLVLDSPALKVDQGQDSRLESGQPVYAGRCVVGRIVQVGRWMSTVRRITDNDYRGLAQLVRRTSQGMQFGAQGEFEGRGEHEPCRLTRVASTQSVRVGDEVYTAGRDNILPFPMYYGKVVHVEHRDGEPYWDIHVEPALRNLELHNVQVLRQRLNDDRLLAN